MSIRTKIKRHFITGLVAILPIVLTVAVIWFLIRKVGGFLGEYLMEIAIFSEISRPLSSILGFIAVVIGIYFVGLITSGFIGRWILNKFDTVMKNVPFIKGFYNATRRLVDTIFVDRSAFSKVVIIKYPWEKVHSLAFLTNEDVWKVDGEEYYNVFIPTSPNPTSGFFLLYPVKDIIETDISIQEGFKVIASGGVILPDKMNF